MFLMNNPDLSSAGSPESNGVLLMNSNAMDILLTKSPPTVTWRSIGGILDFSIFVGDSPLDVIRLYTERVGRPFLPPIWSLGFHLCRLALTLRLFQMDAIF